MSILGSKRGGRGRGLGRLLAGGNGSVDHADPLTAVDELTEANRRGRDGDLERRLLRARHRAFAQLPANVPDSPRPEGGTPLPEHDSIPAIPVTELSAEMVRRGIGSRGCLLVRGLLNPAQTERLVVGIDEAITARRARREQAASGRPDPSPWYEPFRPDPPYDELVGAEWSRQNVDGGAIWGSDSPRGLFELTEVLAEAGVPRVASDYLGERPALSMMKCVLRRVPSDTSGNWHQDGRFLGGEVHALNVWIALSRCGDIAPGLDIVPRRLDSCAETGTEGAMFDWTVSPTVVERVAGPDRPVRPIFEPGDALLFDHLCLHSTAVSDAMTEPRYAAEVWMFGPSGYPDRHVPIVL